LAENRRVSNLQRITDGFSPIPRPSEARNSPYDIAAPRKALGLELKADDEDITKILKNLTWNWLRVSDLISLAKPKKTHLATIDQETARDTILFLQLGQKLKRGVRWEQMQPEDQEMANHEVREISPFRLIEQQCSYEHNIVC
jgi:hypothetical protein